MRLPRRLPAAGFWQFGEPISLATLRFEIPVAGREDADMEDGKQEPQSFISQAIAGEIADSDACASSQRSFGANRPSRVQVMRQRTEAPLRLGGGELYEQHLRTTKTLDPQTGSAVEARAWRGLGPR